MSIGARRAGCARREPATTLASYLPADRLPTVRTLLHSPNAKKALAVVLVLVVVFTGLPIVMGMSGMADCPECDLQAVCSFSCPAVLFGVSLFVAAAAWLLRPRAVPRYRLGFASSLDPPPRLA